MTTDEHFPLTTEGLIRSVVPPGAAEYYGCDCHLQHKWTRTHHCTNDRVFEYYPLSVYECVRVVTVFYFFISYQDQMCACSP